MTEALFISSVSPFSHNTFPPLATLLPLSKPASSPSLLSPWRPPVSAYVPEPLPKETAACSVAGSSGAHTEQAAPCCGIKGAGCCLAGRSNTSSLQLLLPWKHTFILLPSAQLLVFTKPLSIYCFEGLFLCHLQQELAHQLNCCEDGTARR